MLQFLMFFAIFFTFNASAEFNQKKLGDYVSTVNTQIAKQKDINQKLKSLTQLRNHIANTTTKDKNEKYLYLAKLQQAYEALEPTLLAQNKCEIIRADLQFRFNPEGFKKGNIEKPVAQALQTLKAFCPALQIYQ
ncbi:MAG: hypothetical protein R2827_13160 [Bdellovibrionales bacterium]